VRIDSTAPHVACGSADGAWHGANVGLACTAADGGSGLAADSPAAFTLATDVADRAETAAAATGTRSECDLAGNCTTAGPVGANKVDRKAPAITVSAPAENADVLLNAAVSLTYACTDGGSGVASCTGPVASGKSLDTSTPGTHTVTITATDAVGHTSTLVRTYVVRFAAAALQSPLDGSGQHVVKANQTVPVKLLVTDALGAAVTDPGTITDFTGSAAGSPVSTNGAPAFRLVDGGVWQFNLSTAGLQAGSTYTYRCAEDAPGRRGFGQPCAAVIATACARLRTPSLA
jgi:hypothetical protein